MQSDMNTALPPSDHTEVVVHNWCPSNTHAALMSTSTDGGCSLTHPNATTLGAAPNVTAGVFDTILVDYLFGSIEYYSPFGENHLMDALTDRVDLDDGVLLFVGREPFPFPARLGAAGARTFDAAPWAARVVLDTERLRDAAMLLSHQRHYREFPCAWVEEALQLRGFVLHAIESFPIVHSTSTVQRQVQWAEREAYRVADPALRSSLLQRAADLRKAAAVCPELSAERGFAFGGNYAIVASRQRDCDDGRCSADVGKGPSLCTNVVNRLPFHKLQY